MGCEEMLDVVLKHLRDTRFGSGYAVYIDHLANIHAATILEQEKVDLIKECEAKQKEKSDAELSGYIRKSGQEPARWGL